MSDYKLSETAYQDQRDEYADEYVQAQRQAFIDGFEAAAQEAQEFQELQEWAKEQRDKAEAQYQRHGDTFDSAQREAYLNVLVKLSEIGVKTNDENTADTGG